MLKFVKVAGNCARQTITELMDWEGELLPDLCLFPPLPPVPAPLTHPHQKCHGSDGGGSTP